MADSTPSRLPRLSAEQRRAAVGQFERANQVLAAGNFDYGLQLLLNCCQLDPANAVYRKALRQSQKAKYRHNEHGQKLAYVRTLRGRWRLRKALLQKDYLSALVYAEQILMRNPWDLATHLLMAQAFEALDLLDLAVWTLEQVRPHHAKDPRVNRPLARLFERRGNFQHAIALWELIRKEVPTDIEAQHKVKDLAVSATIAKGRYEEAVQGNAPTPLVTLQGDTKTEKALTDETATSLPAAGPTLPKEAAVLYARVKANPTNANAYLHLAGYYRRAEQLDEARAIIQEGLGPTGNHFELALELLDLDIEPFRRDLAVAEERLKKQPNSPEMQRVRASLLKEVNARELDYYRRRVDRFPTDAAARFEMALRLLRGNLIDEAIKGLQAIRSDPRHHGRVLFYLGFCFKTRKNWRLAQRNFEEALPALREDDEGLYKEALYLLAVGCAEAGDRDRAVELACELANVDFGYKNIGGLLDQWQAKVS